MKTVGKFEKVSLNEFKKSTKEEIYSIINSEVESI